jgi:2-C-methyl-D-erythritol 4-phosphate cytidylyltransferase
MLRGLNTLIARNFERFKRPSVLHFTFWKRLIISLINPLFTDDASVVEAAGWPIHLIEGNRENIKITNPSIGESIVSALMKLWLLR